MKLYQTKNEKFKGELKQLTKMLVSKLELLLIIRWKNCVFYSKLLITLIYPKLELSEAFFACSKC